MAIEIERKFRVDPEKLPELPEGHFISQGYISSSSDATVRVRIYGSQGFLTIKSATVGISRSEFEYPIPVEDAQQLLNTLCQKPLIEKTRYRVNYANAVWELDIFSGQNEGLLVAEIELRTADEAFSLPPWVTEEVSEDPKYRNSSLISHPYCNW